MWLCNIDERKKITQSGLLLTRTINDLFYITLHYITGI